MLKLKAYDPEQLRKCKFVENRYVCSICIEIFTSIDILKAHFIDSHGFKQPEPETTSDTDFFSESSDQSSSIALPPVEKPKKTYFSPKNCQICGQKFKNKKTLSKHVKHVHHKLKQLICNICNKQFTRKSTLDVKFQCPYEGIVCKRRHTKILNPTIFQPSLLPKIHVRSHQSDDTAKVLSCNVCNFKCSDPSVMAKHRRLHQSTNEGKYKCIDKECDYYAIQATGLKNHILYKHPQLYNTMKCTQCEFVSVNPERLNQHILNHEKGLLDKREETEKIEEVSKTSLNTSMEISSDCLFPIESTDSIHTQDQGGVTIIHNHSSNAVHNEDAVF